VLSSTVVDGQPAAHRRAISVQRARAWSFVSKHGQVLLAIARDPELRVSEIAEAVGVAERSAYRLLADLVDAGYLHRKRLGRRNIYQLAFEVRLGGPIVGDHTLGQLVALIADSQREHRRDLAPARQA
jgi:DNA-binding transcriptional ArsR family regulator